MVWRRLIGLFVVFLFSVTVLISCKKRESNVGLGVMDPNELLGSSQVDTFQLSTFSILEDSVISDNPAYALLGSYNDPTFGTVNANFYTQLRLSGFNPNFGDITQIGIDSVVLGLKYAGYYGELSAQNVEVHEITESIYLDSTYYSFSTKAVSPVDLVEPGYGIFVPSPDGKTIVGTDTLEAQLRIRLKNSFGSQMIEEASSGGTNFSSNENFLSYLKGLHVKVDNGIQASGKGGVFYFNITHPQSKLTIYYSQSGEQKTFDFLLNSECADFNHVDINNAGKPVQNVLNDTLSGQNEFYAQAFKTRAVVKIPGMKNISSNAVIHKAQLILPIQYQTGAKYVPPNELTVAVRINGNLAGIGLFGTYDYVLKQYTMDIRNFLQSLVSQEVNTDELVISPRMFITSADRVIFNGPNTVNKKKPKLIVTYTTF
jgi:hypothetical protein